MNEKSIKIVANKSLTKTNFTATLYMYFAQFTYLL